MATQIFDAVEFVQSSSNEFVLSSVRSRDPANRVVPSYVVDLADGESVQVFLRLHLSNEVTPWVWISFWGKSSEDHHKKDLPFGIKRSIDELVSETSPIEMVDLKIVFDSCRSSLEKASISFWPDFGKLEIPDFCVDPWIEVERVPQYQSGHKEAGRICGPASLTMALRGLGKAVSLDQLASQAHDPFYKVYGNWTRLACLASSYGYSSWVERGGSAKRIVQNLRNRNLVILSLSWKEHERSDAPIRCSNGHLVLVTGSDEDGLVILDPAYPEGKIQSTHLAWQTLFRCWKSGAMIIVSSTLNV